MKKIIIFIGSILLATTIASVAVSKNKSMDSELFEANLETLTQSIESGKICGWTPAALCPSDPEFNGMYDEF